MKNQISISYFKPGDIVVSEAVPEEIITLETYAGWVRDGKFKDLFQRVVVHPYGTDAYQDSKKDLPFIVPHAVVDRKCLKGVIERSGVFCFDVDLKENPDIKNAKARIKKNPYVYILHDTTGGGFTFYMRVKIDREEWINHNKQYECVADELESVHEIKLDRSQKSLTQARYYSYDPDIFINPDAKIKVIPKPKGKRKHTPQKPLTDEQREFATKVLGNLISFMEVSGGSITRSYDEWVGTGFAIANSFPLEQARGYFHEVSMVDACYDEDECNTVFDRIAKSVTTNNGSADKRGFKSLLRDAEGIGYHIPKELLKQPIQSNVALPEPTQPEAVNPDVMTKKGNTIQMFKTFIASGYDIRRNAITQLLEMDGIEMYDKDFHSIWVRAHEIGINVGKDDVFTILESDFTQDYNPLTEWFETRPKYNGESLTFKLAQSIQTDTYKLDFLWTILRKWMVGAVAGLYPGHINELELVLCGTQFTGKTYFFRALIPESLRKYYAENKLDDGKDSDRLTCMKWIIMDDEYGGKSKVESKRHKEIVSREYVTTRLPYARTPVTMRRICSLCGTTNDPEILADPTGNRRVIPVNVIARNYALFDAIDKEKLWTEVYQLFKDGYNHQLTRDEIEELARYTEGFNRFSLEYELCMRHFRPATKEDIDKNSDIVEYLTASDMLVYIKDRSGMNKVNRVVLGKELPRLGYKQIRKRINGKGQRCYAVVRISIV